MKIWPLRFRGAGDDYLFSDDAGRFFRADGAFLDRYVSGGLPPRDEAFLQLGGHSFGEVGLAYHEFAKARRAVPFVADDIMETFDDFRAEEAFRLFADMARSGQVIYLTHHQHLCEIVRRVCPTVRIHDLNDSVVAKSAVA